MNLLKTLTDPDNLLALFVAIVCFATIVTIATPMITRSTLETRLKSVSSRREELRRKSREALAVKSNGGGTLRHADEGLYKKVVDRLQLSRLLEDPKVVEKLAQAGFRGPRPVSTFYFFRFILPFAFAVTTALYLFLVNDFGMPAMNRVVVCFVGLTLGYYAPNIYISNVAQKRRESIVGAFPDSLDLLLICVESGMSIEAAIQKVSQEIGGTSIELAEELTLLTAEISYLPERRMAYEGLAMRTNHPGIRSVTTAMIQAERYGTPLGSALRVMAKENRDMRLAHAEKKAAQLPAKLTVPMILFFLPVLFIVILGPAVIKVQDMVAQNH
ncbi:type II secretion system F family protein [Phenylobacterium sp. 20VBR1]|uniref:Type II secretion system F family protein n=1 Tax=Phenylobacterium glaciei TaxID=2803784 RepID=A0A941HYN5_9CAUL|nr:type II secretion system F family protein [Phenylobacterium glaciei]MBR7621600.1 type II secretion system F family protein [Phenylobacterium glaciei]